MDGYCNYQDPEWSKRFNGLKNENYRVKIDGNTLHITCQTAERLPVYKKIFGNIYKKIDNLKNIEVPLCTLVMCKIKESTLIDVLESYGFTVNEK